MKFKNLLDLYNNYKLFKNGIENWFSVAINMIILKREVTCKIKNIGSVEVKKGENLLNSSLFRAVVSSNSESLSNKQKKILKTYLNQMKDEIVTITNLEDEREFKFLNKEIFTIFESFFYGEYENIPYCNSNKNLIDIGANLGDTALYFANKGYDVIAFEPLPNICEIAYKNIELNPQYKEKIRFINKAVSYKKGKITISYDNNNSASAGEFKKFNNEIEVETITIEDILQEYQIKPDILKIDCEGCEVNIIKNSNLSMFSEIIMEYHTNFTGVDENILIKILEKENFRLESIKKGNIEGMGIIHMVNVNQ